MNLSLQVLKIIICFLCLFALGRGDISYNFPKVTLVSTIIFVFEPLDAALGTTRLADK